MLKKLMKITLVAGLCLMSLPEKYIFANLDMLQIGFATNNELPKLPSLQMGVLKVGGTALIEEPKKVETEIKPVAEIQLQEKPIKPIEEKAAAISSNKESPINVPTDEKWFIFNSDRNTITGYSSLSQAPKNINIPESIGGVPVYHIADNAFAGQQLTGLTLPEGLQSIGNDAFKNNPSMAGLLVIPDSVIKLGNNAFQDCRGLTSITIGNGVTSLGIYSFKGCIGLTNVKFGNSLKIIENNAFDGCHGLTSIEIPNSVTNIGASAFSSCSSLTSVKLGNGLMSIGNYAFSGCRNLQSIEIPDNVTSIGDGLFASCTGLMSVKFGNSLTSIGIDAFSGCNSLTSIEIPDSITRLGGGAFSGCTSLKNVTIGNGVTNIESSTFFGCTGLRSVIIGNSVKTIGNSAFSGCRNLLSIEIPDSVTSIEVFAFSECSSLRDIKLGNGVTSIATSAFKNCTNLLSIEIPDSVTSIGSTAFSGCSRLKSINIPGKNEGEIPGSPWGAPGTTIVYWKDIKQSGDYLFNTEKNTIVKYLGTAITLVIPSTLVIDGISYPVEIISNNSFSANNGLTSVKIPNSVTSIGNSAFESCSSLMSIEIPNSVISIGDSAFRNCSSLTSIDIPDSVTSIESSAFSGCSKLKSINIPGKIEGEISGASWGAPNITVVFWKNIKQSGDYVFNITKNSLVKYLGNATTLVIPSTLNIDGNSYPVKSIGNDCFYENNLLKNVEIPNSVTSIDNSAFYGCYSLTSIEIPDSVTSIGSSAFGKCSSLVKITLGKNLETIESYAFNGCSRLSAIVIPDSVITLGSSAFAECSELTSIKIGKGITKIASQSFYRCYNLKNVEISNSVTLIESYAFRDCRGLTSIEIPDSVTGIEINAFAGCTSLESIYIPEKNEGAINGAPWGASSDGSSSNVIVYWKDVHEIDEYVFNSSSGRIIKYNGTTTTVNIPVYFSVNDQDVPVKEIGQSAFSKKSNMTKITIPNSVTTIGSGAFESCTSLMNIIIPDSVTMIGQSAFSNCTTLEEAYITKNLTSMGNNVFSNTSKLKIIYMRASRSSLPTSVTSSQPWGASSSVAVWYGGEVVTFDSMVKKVEGKYQRIIDIQAYLEKPALISRIVLPNGVIKNVGTSNWPSETEYYPYGSIPDEIIKSNGTYVFRGFGDDNVERAYPVEINDIGAITLRANEASITEQMAHTITEQEVLDLLNVSAEDELGQLTNGTDSTIWISPEDMAKIHTLRFGDVIEIRVNVKSSRSGSEVTAYRNVTLNTTSCIINADNVDLWQTQIASLTKEELLNMMNPSVIDSTGSVDMSKLVLSDEDFAKIKTGVVGTYNVMLTYDTNKAKKRVRVTIMDSSPATLIKIPSDIKLSRIDNDSTYGVGAEETVSIQTTTDTTMFPLPFTIRTDPSFWLAKENESVASMNQMKVVVLNADDQLLTPDNNLLATLSGSTIQEKAFKLRGYHNEWNTIGAYSGIMNFYITYGGS